MLNATTIRKITQLGLLLLTAFAGNIHAGTLSVTADNKTGLVDLVVSDIAAALSAGCPSMLTVTETDSSGTAEILPVEWSSDVPPSWSDFRDSGTYEYRLTEQKQVKGNYSYEKQSGSCLDSGTPIISPPTKITIDRNNVNNPTDASSPSTTTSTNTTPSTTTSTNSNTTPSTTTSTNTNTTPSNTNPPLPVNNFTTLKPMVSLLQPVAGTQLQTNTAYNLKAQATSLDLRGTGIASVVVKYAGADYPMMSGGPGIYELPNFILPRNAASLSIITITATDNNGTSSSVAQAFPMVRPSTSTTTPTNQGLDFNKYDIFYVHFSPGSNDIYLRGKKRFVLIAADISIPLLLDDGVPSYMFFEDSSQPGRPHGGAMPFDYLTDSELAALQAVKAIPGVDYVTGDINNDTFADAVVRGAGQYDNALLIGGRLVNDGVYVEPVFLGDISSDGRSYTPSKGWSSDTSVKGNVSNRSQALSIAGGNINLAGVAYRYTAETGVAPPPGQSASQKIPDAPAANVAQPR